MNYILYVTYIMTNWFSPFLLETLWLRVTLILFMHIITPTLTDNRCYLENGASSETFFVSEDLPVGEVLGRVRFLGDPRPGIGSVHVRLKEIDSPIAIESGTKNLVLQRPLDKEGIDGPSSVFLNLLCTRLGTKDLDFVIPVNIRVTDANDNKPVFVNLPYKFNVSEATVVGTKVFDRVKAVDNDQQGPNSDVKYLIIPGPNSDFFAFENEMEGILILRKPLDYEQMKSLNFTIRAQDHGDPPLFEDTTVVVHVQDFDDQNPRFKNERYTAVVPEPPIKGTILPVKPHEINAFDQDEGIREKVLYYWDGTESYYSVFLLNSQTGQVNLARDLKGEELGQPAILVIKAVQENNKDRYALATLTISRQVFHEGLRFAQRIFNVVASEALPPGSIIAVLSNNKIHQPLKYFVSNEEILKIFMINSLGEISLKRKLDYEKESEYVFKVFATDGKSNDSCLVNITIENINEWEPQFRYARYEFIADLNKTNKVIGRVEVADGDRDDNVTLTVGGVDADLFSVNRDGEVRLNSFKRSVKPTASFTITATDSGKPQKAMTVPVVVRFSELTTSDSKLNAVTRDSSNSMMSNMLMAGLGATLLLLSFIFVFLIACLCKMKQKPPPLSVSGNPEKLSKRQPQVTNPVYGDDKPQALFSDGNIAILPRVESRQSILSQSGVISLGQSNMTQSTLNQSILKKQNLRNVSQSSTVLWPAVGQSVRVKECWAENDEENADTELDSSVPKVLRSSNLTVYF